MSDVSCSRVCWAQRRRCSLKAFRLQLRLLVVYEQPPCPEDGYFWSPGYWAYGDDGYFWVPGAWVEVPQPGYFWTPGYWGFGDGIYRWHDGYWGPHVGFYGGINYELGIGEQWSRKPV